MVSSRVTQLYDEGACVYFYYLMDGNGLENPSAIYHEIEEAARDEILSCGGNLSHHHGVGKIRAGFMKRVVGSGFRELVSKIKSEIDPENVFAVANLGISEMANI